jgi:membrane protein implicated in regulation of membrane protease activity
MKQLLSSYLDDVFYWLGAGLITAGAYLALPKAAWFVAGLFCLIYAFLIARAKA